MIIPFLKGWLGPFRAPMTWAIFVLNLIVLGFTQVSMEDIQERLESLADNSELAQIQGRLFGAHIIENAKQYPSSYVELAQEALAENSKEKIELLGALALRDTDFFKINVREVASQNNAEMLVDPVEKKWWQKQVKDILLIREAHAGYALGLTEENHGGWQWLTYQFVHSDFSHFFVNMVVFLIFGAALESVIGPLALLLAFLFSGFGAALIYLNIDNVSAIPLIGASGSVSGIVSLFCVLFWNHGVRAFYLLFIPQKGYVGFVYLPGWLILFLWVLADLSGFFSTPGELGGVAHSAHIGGQITGAALAILLALYFKIYPELWRKKTNQAEVGRLLGPKLKTHSL